MRVLPGQIDRNFKTMCSWIERARSSGCTLVAFPEMCVGGYLLGDLWTSRTWCEELMACNEAIRELSREMVVVWGNLWLDPAKTNKDGRERKYNAAWVAADGKWVPRANNIMPAGPAIKTLLPTYRIFDDERYFFSQQDYAIEQNLNLEQCLSPYKLQSPIGTLPESCLFAVQICEDLWFKDYQLEHRNYNVGGMQLEQGASLIINLSASPWTWGKNEARHRRVQEVFQQASKSAPFLYVNCTGVQNNGKNLVTFDGSSTVYGSDALPLACIQEPYLESMLMVDFAPATGKVSIPQYQSGNQQHSVIVHTPEVIQASAALPSGIPLAKTAAHYLAACEAIRSLDELMGKPVKFVIGLSGGIDSAVSACLIASAVGAERLHCFNLPSKYNSNATIGAAAIIARELGCHYAEISIEALIESNNLILQGFNPNTLHLENIQAKIRGTAILSNIAGILDAVMTNNGNKVEIALGYATLYGDVNGAIAPLGDLLKTEVFALGHYLNRHIFKRAVIPESLFPDESFNFEIAPSAELKDAQRDPMKWGYHDALLAHVCTYRGLSPIEILELYDQNILFQRILLPEALVKLYNLRDPAVFIADLEWFFGAFYRSVFKRIQAPPIVIMSRSSFGYDFRESQLPWEKSLRYQQLKQKILAVTRS